MFFFGALLIVSFVLVVDGKMSQDDWCKGGLKQKGGDWLFPNVKRPHLHCFGNGASIDSSNLLDGNNNDKYCSTISAFEKTYAGSKDGTNEAKLYPVMAAMVQYYGCCKSISISFTKRNNFKNYFQPLRPLLQLHFFINIRC